MKKLVAPFIFAVFLSACSNDLDLTTEWQDIPIVYAIVNEQDTAHYFRVEKAFLDPQTSALVLAQNPDSIYYQNATVTLERPDRNEIVTLERVDGNLEGYPRTTGVFVDSPNFLYKAKFPRGEELQGGERIILTVNRGDKTTPAIVSTTVLGAFELVNNQPGDLINWSRYDRRLRFSWRPDEEAAVFDAVFRINYDESVNNGPFESRFVDWVVANNIIPDEFSNNDRVTIEPVGESFYNFLGDALEERPNVERRFRNLDFIVTAGGEELLEYINIRQANTGITSSQDIPIFSNVENGLGLMSSTYTVVKEGISITIESQDSLIDGIFTRNLGFQ